MKSKMKIKLTNLTDITPYYNNPRDNRPAVEPVIESIKRFGFIKPIVVDSKGVIIVGHTRYLAAVHMSLDKVPVVFTDMDGELAKQYRIADNKLAEKSVYDEDALIQELKAMKMPEEMQAFFFEDLNGMLNFSYDQFAAKTPTSAYFTPEENDESTQPSSYSPSYSESADEDYTNDESEDDSEPQENKTDMYKVYIEDGHRKMNVYCPYCGNIETITLD